MHMYLCVLKRVKRSSHDTTIDARYSLDLTSKFYMVAELVISNNDVFKSEFPESPRESEACEVPRRNTITSTVDAVD